MNVPYLPGSGPPPELPLGRFLPPVPQGMVAAWCRENLNPGCRVLEPFGFNPLVSIEIALAGFPVLVTVNNPIQSFILQVLASAPQQDELVAALQDLAVCPKGDDRMEPYIRSLYQVNCADCHRQVEADAFLWRKGENQPYAVQVDCPFCGARGEQAVDEEMLSAIAPLPPFRLHQARALNRITSKNDPLRPQVMHALNAYPTRPLIVLQTIINKLESLEQTPRRRELLTALVLCAADQGNTLWAYPSPRDRPRQIVVPAIFQEKNLWKVMENAIDIWQVLDAPISLSEWDGTLPESPGIYRFQGRIKELDPKPEEEFSAVVTAIPRPNQAFWTLAALWTGWIWGQDAVAPIRQVLSRQRYDWNWHTNALGSVFETLHSLSGASTRFWAVITENEPMLLLASLLAADYNGFRLNAFAQSVDDELAQVEWEHLPDQPRYAQPQQTLVTARKAAADYLLYKGEPASYQQVHAAAITGLADENKLAVGSLIENPNQAASETNSLIETVFTEPGILYHINAGSASLETGDWWLVGQDEAEMPLIDRVEQVLYDHLVNVRQSLPDEIMRVVFEELPGIFTPEREVLLSCLESYADPVDPETHLWELRDHERPEIRQADLESIVTSLHQIGQQLSYQVQGENPLFWIDDDQGQPAYCFNILSTAVIYPCYHPLQDARSRVLVIPGSRANLLAYKKQRDPLLKNRLEKDFVVMKYRLVRDLEVNPLLSRELFNEQILVDPPEYHSSQLALF
jgi:hypothetical protein